MKAVKIFIVCIMVIFISGCWDKIEVEEYGFVAVLGLDKGSNGGVSVTFQVSNPQVGSTDIAKSDREPASEIMTINAPDILTARDMADAVGTRRLLLSHTRVLIIGEDMARDKDFFSVIESILRDRELRRNMNVIVSKEKASEFIRNNRPPLETRPHKFYDFLEKRWHETGFVPLSDLHNFMQRAEEGEGLYLTIYGTTIKGSTKFGQEDQYLPGQIQVDTENPTQIIGSAVFKNGKMIGVLNGEETRVSLLLRAKFRMRNILVSYPDPIDEKFKISGRLSQNKDAKLQINISGDKPSVNMTIPVTMDVLDIPSFVDYVENLENQELLKKSIEEDLNQKAGKLIYRTQEEFKGEPFLWSRTVRKEFWTYDDFKNYEWMKMYPQANVQVKFDLTLKGFGKQLKPPSEKNLKE